MICVGVRLRGSIGYPTVQQQSTTAKIRDTTPDNDMEGQDRRYISQQILHLESPLDLWSSAFPLHLKSHINTQGTSNQLQVDAGHATPTS